MTWSLTMLLVHLAVLGALLTLWPTEPPKPRPGESVAHLLMQRIVVGLLIVAAAAFAVYWAAEAFGVKVPWQLKLAAHQAEHAAILLYVLRIFIADQERRCLPKSSVHFPSSPRS